MKVLVFGTFDRLHPGHLFFLNEAEKRGALHIVVARDANVQKIKKHTPVQSQEVRMLVVQKSFPHAHVVLGDSHDFLVPVCTVDPDLILLGYDQCLPPGVQETDFQCPIERIGSLEPDTYKSSLLHYFPPPAGES